MDLTTATDLFRRLKEERVAGAAEGDHGDIEPVLWVYRNGGRVASLTAPAGRDMMLAAALLAVPGFGADELFMVVDAHVASLALDPRTGLPWAPGAMQQFCDDERGCDLGVIVDCLAVTRTTRTGDVELVLAPYRIRPEARSVAWAETPDTSGSDLTTGGLVADHLRLAFAVRNSPECALAHAFAATDPQLRQRFDEVTTEKLAALGLRLDPPAS